MNVEVETLPNCVASLHIELPPEVVTKQWNEVARTFRQAVRIPGFRPGKAPQNVVEAKFRKEIQEELTKKLVSETTREAIREKGLKVLSISDVEGVEFTPERSMKFTATLITSPEFELPEYKGLPVRVPSEEVAPEDVDKGLQSLRERQATFSDLEGRALELNDFAVIDFTTTLEGKPLHEVEPKAPKILHGRNDFWVKLDEQTLLKGFSEHLVGMTPNEAREFDVQVPGDYPVATLANQVLHFNVTLKAIKSMQLPELTEEFASQIEPGLTFEQLKRRIEGQTRVERKRRIEILKQNQILDYLASRVECELPQSYVKEETLRIMSEIVQQNQLRGVSEEVLRENQKDIISTASRNARERLKTNFILNRIAEKEGIEVEPEEVRARVRAMANQYRVKYEKMMSDLEEKHVLGQVREEVLMGKVLDFLTSSATVEVVPEEALNG
jgi:trigger factor